MCRGDLKGYDTVTKVVRNENGMKTKRRLRRYKCVSCNRVHREIPNDLIPYKQYRKDIVEGFVNSALSSSDLEFEDYPCDLTQKRWSRKNNDHNDER